MINVKQKCSGKYFLDTNVIINYIQEHEKYVFFIENAENRFYYTSTVKEELLKLHSEEQLRQISHILRLIEYPKDRPEILENFCKYVFQQLNLQVPKKFEQDLKIYGEACYMHVEAMTDDENQLLPKLLTNNMKLLKRFKRNYNLIADIVSAVGLESPIEIEDIRLFI